MRYSNILLSGLVLFIVTFTYTDAARRNRKRPSIGDSLNVGGLADSIMDALRPTIDNAASNVHSPINRNNRGNPNGRQSHRTMPQEPQEIDLTVDQIIEQYPWIENPQAIVDSTNQTSSSTASSDRGGTIDSARDSGRNMQPAANSFGRNNQRGGPKSDGRTRFNNPRYLRDRLYGLNRDNYGFRVTQGVKTGNGKYKVKLNQEWRNLPIYGTALVLEQEPDTNLILESADGEFLSGVEEDITSETPRLSKDAALEKALLYNQDQGKNIENPSTELFVDTIGDRAVLAYLVNYFVPGTPPQDSIVTESPITSDPPTMSTTTAFPVRNRWRTSRAQARARARRRRCRRVQRRGGWRRGCQTTPAPSSSDESGMTTMSSTSTTDSDNSMIEEIQSEARNHSEKQVTEEQARREWLIINANTGALIKKWTGLAAAMKMSRVPLLVGLKHSSLRYEELLIKDSSKDECYYQKIVGHRAYLTVSDVRKPSLANFLNAYSFNCSEAIADDYDITNGARSPRNSAYKWASEAINFFRRASNSRFKFNVEVQVHHPGFRAYWTGRRVVLGDGDDRHFYPMTAPDIVVHEIAHAFTEHQSGLQYHSQSGAIDESYADMAATAFMNYFFDDDTPNVYKVGRTVSKYGLPLRDMCNPRNPRLLFHNPDTPIITSQLHWNPNRTNVHNASALYNIAFCRLSTTPGWTIFTAFKVFTAANMVYWRPTETFNSAACGVRIAAYDLMSTEKAEDDVDRAFAAVDVSCPEADRRPRNNY